MYANLTVMKEDRLMPTRGLGLFLLALFPTLNLPISALFLQGGIAASAFVFLSPNRAVWWLSIGMIFDVVLGACCGVFLNGGFKTKAIAQGVLVKGAALVMVALLSKEPILQFEIASYTASPGEFLAVWFLLGEIASVAKKMGRLGMPWPKGVTALLDRVHTTYDHADIGKMTSVFKTSSSQTGGDTEVTSKTETTITTTPPKEEKP